MNQRIENFITRLEYTVKQIADYAILEDRCKRNVAEPDCSKLVTKEKAYKMRLEELKQVVYGLFE